MDTSPSIGTKEHIQWWRTWATFFSVKKVPNCTNSTQPSPRQGRVKSCFVAFPTTLHYQNRGKEMEKNPSGTSRFFFQTSSFTCKVLWNFEGWPKIQTQKKNCLPPFTGPYLWSSKASSCSNFCQKLQVPLGIFYPRISRKILSFPMSSKSIYPISFCGKRKRKIQWLQYCTRLHFLKLTAV